MLLMKVADAGFEWRLPLIREESGRRHEINQIKIKSLLCSPHGRKREPCLSSVKHVIVKREAKETLILREKMTSKGDSV